MIIVGYSETPEGRAAVERAAAEAQLRGAELLIVRAMRLGAADDADRAREWSRNVEEAQAAGDQLVRGLRDRGLEVSFDVETAADSAAGALLDAARNKEAELIVIGIRRRSPVGKLVLGSVSQDVILQAECPVLAVKASN